MRGNNHSFGLPVRLALTVAFAGAFVFAAVPVANAALMDTFVTAGKAQARWINEPAAPPGSTDTQSIELAVEAKSAIDFNDAAWVTFTGFAPAAPATPPSFLYKISQAGASGGSVRLVMRFSDGGYGFLRPLTLQAGQWALANGAGNNWESTGGIPCGTELTYAQMLACHPGTSVTSVEIINDSGWLYTGRFSALIDNISYGGEVLTKPAPPVIGERVNISPVSGQVKVRLPEIGKGASERSDLDTVDGLTQGLPVGSKIDTRRGTIKLKAVRGGKGTKYQTGKFTGSVFTVTQQGKGHGKGLTTLRLKAHDRKICGGSQANRSSKGDPLANTARRRRRGLLRKLRGRANGRFRTRGRYSSAAVTGTIWETSDRCEGTLVRVIRGGVNVRDFRKKKTVHVNAGQSYLARAPGY